MRLLPSSFPQKRFGSRLYLTVLGCIPFSSLLLKWSRQVRHRLWPYKEVIETGQYTVRTGTCNQCGACCKNLFLTYGKQVIQTVEEFQALQALHPDEYRFFEAQYETETGLVFKCHNLGGDNLCMDYEARPVFCRSYPNETGILMGAKLPSECSFTFTPLRPFKEVLEKATTIAR
jgi:Fe-S-cluster containining protein